jgi:hypothetical protein
MDIASAGLTRTKRVNNVSGSSFLVGTIHRILLLIVLMVGALPRVQAAIPIAARNDPLYAKGYLDVSQYPGVFNDGTSEATTTAGLNEAIDDAYVNDLVAYFPPGTYLVNDTLTATTKTGWDGVTDDFATPRNHIAIIGSTAGASRPLIRLAPGAAGFSDPTSPKPVVEFRNLDKNNTGNEKADEGYHQMLRGVDLDCSGQAGAIALYFNNAQNSSIENVKITATGAFTGLRGLPNAGTGVVNIEIEGGQYGIDDVGAGGSGSVIAGAVLRNQTITAVRHQSFAPVTFVGFEIVTAPGSTTAAVTIDPGFNQANFAALSFVDGIIRLGGAPAVAAIDNRSGSGKNFYARNVYVTGADALVKSGAQPVVSGTGTWKLINEYSYCNQAPVNFEKISMDLIDGVTTRTPGPLNNGEVVSINDNVAAPPSDLLSRHVWAALPSVDDPDAVDAFAFGIAPGNVSAAALQSLIDTHRKIFLRKGIYYIDGTITLRKDTILYGVDRNLTRIEVNPSWNPISETAMITTDNDATATTYLGDLSVGVDATDLANDWFVAVDWQAGRNSMVHTGLVYRAPAQVNPINRRPTQPHSLLRIRNAGGGRWYFAGSVKTFTSEHPDYRILKVEGTTEPLWFYALNPEHPAGPEAYVEFRNASNIRIYSVKSEFSAITGWEDKSGIFRFDHVTNLALFGHGALRNAVQDRGIIEFIESDRVLATLVAPQLNRLTATGDTLRETWLDVQTGIAYPNVVSLYKRGAITAADEAAMAHAGASYGPVGDNTPPTVEITSPVSGTVIPFEATTVTATASDSNGTVTQVNFYANAALIGSDGTAPYSISWTPPSAGSYVLGAIAIDNAGATTASAGVTVATAPAVTLTEVTFVSIGTEDGWILESTETSEVGGSILIPGNGPLALTVGDNATRQQYKTILSFDTSTIPADAVILAASLELRRGGGGTLAALSGLGDLQADIRTGNFGGTNAIELADFAAPATVAQVALLSLPAANTDWSIGALTEAGRTAINRAGGRTQFRVAFANGDNDNATQNILGFFSGENPTAANRPILRVSYAMPPLILSPPLAQTVTAGGAAVFSVFASGLAPLSYQWRYNGAAITGNPSALTETLTLAAVTTSQAGNYDCVVTSPAGSITSAGALLTVMKAPATITLGALTQTYDGTPHQVTATTLPTGLAVTLTYNGDATAPINAGSYTVAATINDADYFGSASGTLVVTPATATITLGGLSHIYDSFPHAVTAASVPAGLAVTLTYNGSASAPANSGSYAINAVVANPNYIGSATGTLVISPAPATITLAPLTQRYDGTPRIVTATTIPADLPVILTYDGSATAPSTPGDYVIEATINDANHTGTTSGTLIVTTTALVRHAPSLSGGLDGSIQVLQGENISLNGNAWVSGDLLVPGTPNVRLNGHPIFGGTLEGPGSAGPSDYQVTLNGKAILRHLVRRSDPLTMPAISAPPAPAGNRDVAIQITGQSFGDPATLRNLTLNGAAGDHAVPAGTYGSFDANGTSGFILGEAGATAPVVYNLQRLTLNGNARLQIVSPVVLVLARGGSIDGGATVTGDPEWLTLAVASDGLTLNGNANFTGSVVAPSGTVTINGNATLTGHVASDRLTINGNGLLEEATP